MQAGKLGAVRWCLVAAGCALALEATPACAQAVLQTQEQANDRIRSLSRSTVAPPREYVIGKGDLVVVEVYDIQELTRDVRVSQTGTIGLPLVPVRLYVAGLTELQMQQKIAEVLQANGLVSHPQVMVSVKEKKSKPITIVGAVAHPMVYHADRPLTLVQILAEAGGIAADAGETVIITRTQASEATDNNEPPEIGTEDAVPATNPSLAPAEAPMPKENGARNSTATQAPAFPGPEIAAHTVPQGNGPEDRTSAPPPISTSDLAPIAQNTMTVNLSELLERGDTQNNIQLQGGDIVTVPHAGIVYALGAVQKPGGFVANNDRAQLSTLKLLALAGGMTRIAKKDRAIIIRKDSMGNQQSIPVDLGKIIERKSEDVRLMPSDILYVPDNATKAALIRAAQIGLAVGTSLIIYRIGTGN